VAFGLALSALGSIGHRGRKPTHAPRHRGALSAEIRLMHRLQAAAAGATAGTSPAGAANADQAIELEPEYDDLDGKALLDRFTAGEHHHFQEGSASASGADSDSGSLVIEGVLLTLVGSALMAGNYVLIESLAREARQHRDFSRAGEPAAAAAVLDHGAALRRRRTPAQPLKTAPISGN